jgi:hypothetical protein
LICSTAFTQRCGWSCAVAVEAHNHAMEPTGLIAVVVANSTALAAHRDGVITDRSAQRIEEGARGVKSGK